MIDTYDFDNDVDVVEEETPILTPMPNIIEFAHQRRCNRSYCHYWYCARDKKHKNIRATYYAHNMELYDYSYSRYGIMSYIN